MQSLYSLLRWISTGTSTSKVAPIKLGFSEDTNIGEGHEQDEQSADTGDTKGLSHTLRYTTMIFWMYELTLRHMQLLPPKRFLH
jgi:hypothetical protein